MISRSPWDHGGRRDVSTGSQSGGFAKEIYAAGSSLAIELVTARGNASRAMRTSLVHATADDKPFTPDARFLDHLERVSRVEPPVSWIEEGCEPPSQGCRRLAIRVLADLYGTAGLTPWRCGASRLGGILLAYRAPRRDVELEIEIDNDLDVVGVVSTDRDVLQSSELVDSNEWIAFARTFRRLAVASRSP